jgi:hypothetical protein
MKRTLLALTAAAALGACGGPAATAPTSNTAADTPATTTTPAAPDNERIGELALGDTAASVVARYGEPASRSEPIEYGATGDNVSTWAWPAHGLKVDISLGDAAGGGTVLSISVEAPSTLTTSRGVGIGTPRAEVERIYAEHQTEESRASTDDTTFLVGSLYGGTFFWFADGAVTSMFVGAAAE